MSEKLKVLDLFSGIGGFSLGLERTGGFETVQFCEIDPYCQKVLRKHWPEVPIHDDIETIGVLFDVDIITAGFPCQPFSTASRGRQTAADLWPAAFLAVQASKPRWVVVENVPGLGDAGIDRVCDDLQRAGYSCGPFDCDTALPGRQRARNRIIILAHSDSKGESRCPINAEVAGIQKIPKPCEADIARLVGMDDGLSGELDPNRGRRLKALGNAIVPQIATLIGHAILAAEGAEKSRIDE